MKKYQVSIGRDKAIELTESEWWKDCSSRQIAEFQLFTAELSCPFDVFHGALEESLGRPVWKHELGLDLDGIVQEFLGKREKPTMQEIINLIPEEKRFIVIKEAP